MEFTELSEFTDLETFVTTFAGHIAIRVARQVVKDHAPAAGNTVNLTTGAYQNSIGAPVLTTVWSGPEFDGRSPTLYYARTLEIPTPRWSTLVAIRHKLPIPPGSQATIQERAWSSPIWFTPAGFRVGRTNARTDRPG